MGIQSTECSMDQPILAFERGIRDICVIESSWIRGTWRRQLLFLRVELRAGLPSRGCRYLIRASRVSINHGARSALISFPANRGHF